jgi:hypothetical protein
MSREQYKAFNCYSVLGVAATATPGEIRRAWVKRSRRSHPDRGGSHDEQTRINVAYEVLSDPIARQAHNIYWNLFGRYGFPRSDPFAEANRRGRAASNNNAFAHWQKSGAGVLLRFRERLDQAVKKEKAETWAGLDQLMRAKEKEFLTAFGRTRVQALWMMFGMIMVMPLALELPVFWLAVAALAGFCFPKLIGVDIGGKIFSIFDLDAEENLRQHAASRAHAECKRKAKSFEKHASSCATFVEILTRPSTYDDSEIQVARRLAGCMFLTGYMPVHFDLTTRTLLCSDGDEKILVRFRHRTGNASNRAYVEKLVMLAKKHGATKAVIFSSPGFSQNATAYADNNAVKYYSLDSMNVWIDEIISSNYAGPAGDILKNTDRLSQFLITISPRVARRPRQPPKQAPIRHKLAG